MSVRNFKNHQNKHNKEIIEMQKVIQFYCEDEAFHFYISKFSRTLKGFN